MLGDDERRNHANHVVFHLLGKAESHHADYLVVAWWLVRYSPSFSIFAQDPFIAMKSAAIC